jgi:hypothetical protein
MWISIPPYGVADCHWVTQALPSPCCASCTLVYAAAVHDNVSVGAVAVFRGGGGQQLCVGPWGAQWVPVLVKATMAESHWATRALPKPCCASCLAVCCHCVAVTGGAGLDYGGAPGSAANQALSKDVFKDFNHAPKAWGQLDACSQSYASLDHFGP